MQGIVNTLLQCLLTADLLFDRAHRSLGPKIPDPTKLTDVICQVLYFHIKENIIAAACQQQVINFDDVQNFLLPVIFRHILALGRGMKTLLEAPRNKDNP